VVSATILGMLAYNEVTTKKCIILDGNPYKVLYSHVFRKQQRKPVNQTKLRNLINGKVTERSFHQSESVEEVELERKNVIFLYKNRGEYWFCEEAQKSKRFKIDESILSNRRQFIKENSTITLLMFKEKIIGVELPVKIDLMVKEASPAVRGDTSQGAVKQVVLETGATINTPLFINEGDIVRVNTETGAYAERVEKNN
jgi:elongation factor P